MTWENRIVFEVSSAEPDAEVPVWVDLSSRILDDVQAVRLQIGRQNDLDQSEPSRLDLLLNNSDDALTFGNTSSPYASWWGPGRKCRLRDTVNGARLTLFTGYLESPTEVVVTAGIEARVSITAVDRLGRLADSPKFVSTLAAYIVGTRPVIDLSYYWPLGDTSATEFVPAIGREPLMAYDTGVLQTESITPQGGAAPPGDDLSPMRFDVTYSGGVPIASSYLKLTFATPIVIHTGDTITICFWARAAAVDANNPTSSIVMLQGGNPVAPTDEIIIGNLAPGVGGTWSTVFALNSGAWGANADIAGNDYDVPQFLTAQMTLGAAPLERVGSRSVTTVPVGVLPTSATYQWILVGVDYVGSLSHLQIYLTRPGGVPPTAAEHLAQYQMGLLGLERQPTGDRIRTIAAYAGLPNVDVANTIDPGSSVMQRAELAGKTPLDAMREAETTEQGLLHTDADGRLVFKDRRTLYNI